MTTIIHQMIKWWRTTLISHTQSVQSWHLKPNQAYYTTKPCFVPLNTFIQISSRTPKCMYSWIVPDIFLSECRGLVYTFYIWNIWLNWIIKIDWLCSFQPKMRWKSIDSLFLWGPHVIYVKSMVTSTWWQEIVHLSLPPLYSHWISGGNCWNNERPESCFFTSRSTQRSGLTPEE